MPLLRYVRIPVYLAPLALFMLIACRSDADMVTLDGGEEIAGLIVDEYADRIVISTYAGERTVRRGDIAGICYDDIDTRLIKLGDEALNTRRYEEALYYYKLVLKRDPESAAAKDGMRLAVRGKLQSGARKAREEVELVAGLEEADSSFMKPAGAYESDIRRLLGLELAPGEKEGMCRVAAVVPGSAGADNGIITGDRIASVWNRDLGYMPYDEVIRALDGPEYSVVKLGLERDVSLEKERVAGLDIGLAKDGYFVKAVSETADNYGGVIAPGDKLTAVNGASTRYMPRETLHNMLKAGEGPVELRIKRHIYVTRERR